MHNINLGRCTKRCDLINCDTVCSKRPNKTEQRHGLQHLPPHPLTKTFWREPLGQQCLGWGCQTEGTQATPVALSKCMKQKKQTEFLHLMKSTDNQKKGLHRPVPLPTPSCTSTHLSVGTLLPKSDNKCNYKFYKHIFFIFGYSHFWLIGILPSEV